MTSITITYTYNISITKMENYCLVPVSPTLGYTVQPMGLTYRVMLD